ncbi:hypothetical protein E2C01_017958 [Portunus trituberculatus]|uniref:Secreted protein n=1 Tax=Portunus trituberculatus TaxID=210409 RepID=A0A5B7DVE7_PORTR|nr:hypothetical protein [Portunus trituberculatus]
MLQTVTRHVVIMLVSTLPILESTLPRAALKASNPSPPQAPGPTLCKLLSPKLHIIIIHSSVTQFTASIYCTKRQV